MKPWHTLWLQRCQKNCKDSHSVLLDPMGNVFYSDEYVVVLYICYYVSSVEYVTGVILLHELYLQLEYGLCLWTISALLLSSRTACRPQLIQGRIGLMEGVCFVHVVFCSVGNSPTVRMKLRGWSKVHVHCAHQSWKWIWASICRTPDYELFLIVP